ncbi:methyltransferase domain-containing protein [Paenibacillus alkaliterrae]|uniref:methyltransferase domain-containing protein n=1 Tax=Paenibacillus alkaliterrae TaxID=320909 RepID=UPI001F261EC9|nr:methyltransferase domain-containing protein [Paenibacillus alkaliterrae]MCF2939426.1 methyltransferase domain-containing protein [Paenibacillus alkaliterrae]
MPRALRERAIAAELMDDFSSGGEELREALRELRILNLLFAAAAPTLYGVKRLWRAAGKPKRLSVMDVGAGSGDVNRRLLQWAAASGVDLTVTLVDATEEACAEARLLFHDEPRVQVMRGDLFVLPEGGADIVTGTQLLHHFAEEELPAVVASMLKGARLGVVVNDIHRHWIAWTAVWLATRIISSNRYIRNDGPLSVAKGFRAKDWERLKEAIGPAQMDCSWRPLFRYAVVIGKTKPAGGVEWDGT